MPFLKPVNLTISSSCCFHTYSFMKKSLAADTKIAPSASGSYLLPKETVFFQFTPKTIVAMIAPFVIQGQVFKISIFFNIRVRFSMGIS